MIFTLRTFLGAPGRRGKILKLTQFYDVAVWVLGEQGGSTGGACLYGAVVSDELALGSVQVSNTEGYVRVASPFFGVL